MEKTLPFYDTTIGRKALLAITGVILYGFVIVHMLGNLQVFLGPEKFNAYAKQVREGLLDAGVRADSNMSDDRVGYKIRDASLKKVPYVIVVGEKEQEAKSINVRSRDDGSQVETTLEQFLRDVSFAPPKRAAQAIAAE